MRLHKPIILLALTLAACQTAGPAPPATTAAAGLTPYATRTLTPSPGASQAAARSTPRPSPTPPPPPTATPFTYEIKKGDTLLSIAFQYGISLDQLRLANPEVDPNLLSVGTRLVIPLGGPGTGTPQVMLTPPPLAVQMGEPACYPSEDGGAWCFIGLENGLSQPVENVVAWLNLVAADGEVIAGKEAAPPLNRIPAGQNLPLLVHFDTYPQQEVEAQAALLSALPVPEDGRYLEVEAEVEAVNIPPGGLQAVVHGRLVYPVWKPVTATPPATAPSTTLRMPPTEPAVTPSSTAPSTALGTPPSTALRMQEAGTVQQPAAGLIWVALVAYGEDGQVVGVRRWEAPEAIAPGGTLPFEAAVFSAGPPIARVEVVVEARPLPAVLETPQGN